ncbi:MAG: LiaI-LiaF-like domain-containing protein [Terriglobales bacterium]
MAAPPPSRPIPPRDCPACRSRGITGPVVLITLGVLFLLQMTMPRWGFDQTWPILLIAIGAVGLAQRAIPHRHHDDPDWRR